MLSGMTRGRILPLISDNENPPGNKTLVGERGVGVGGGGQTQQKSQ